VRLFLGIRAYSTPYMGAFFRLAAEAWIGI